MNVKIGCVGFHVAFSVPKDAVKRMESFLETHEKFMRETHHIEGNVEPVILCYAVLKSPELNNPLDPSSGETGNTLYGITEIYTIDRDFSRFPKVKVKSLLGKTA